MVSEEIFKIGDPVWAKMKSYPPWPAKIVDPHSQGIKAAPPKHKKSHFVFFFGTENYAWIANENINHHSESALSKLGEKKKSASYQSAIDALINYINQERSPSPAESKDETVEDKTKETKEDEKSDEVSAVKSTPKSRVYNIKRPLKIKSAKRSPHSINGVRKPEHDHSLPRKKAKTTKCDNFRRRAQLHSIALGSMHYNEKQIKPAQLKIGFIGFGKMGSEIAKNIAKTGHNLTVFWTNSVNCDPCVKLGATRAQSAAELILKCDIVISCVKDGKTAKELIFNERGVLKGLEEASEKGMGTRSYVEMTLMSSEDSILINDAISMKQGYYMEAPFYGTFSDAQKGSLIILAAGNTLVFSDCRSCFHAIGQKAMFLNCDIGGANQLVLYLNMFNRTMDAILCETMVLGQKSKIADEDLKTFLYHGLLDSLSMVENMKAMLQIDATLISEIEKLPKWVNGALKLSNDYAQPMPITGATNEIFKHIEVFKKRACENSKKIGNSSEAEEP